MCDLIDWLKVVVCVFILRGEGERNFMHKYQGTATPTSHYECFFLSFQPLCPDDDLTRTYLPLPDLRLRRRARLLVGRKRAQQHLLERGRVHN